MIIRSNATIALRENIEHLLVEAGTLFRRRSFALSAHVSILCAEECAKLIVSVCRENLPDEVYRRRFQHLHKHRILSAHWFISGGLSIVYLMHVAAEQGFLGGDRSARELVLDDLSRSCGWNDPAALANMILRSLELPGDAPSQIEFEAAVRAREMDRVRSVYVDLDENMDVISRPSEIGREISKKYLRDARIAAAIIRTICSENIDLASFVRSLPREMRNEIHDHASKMITHVRDSRPPNSPKGSLAG